MVGLGANNGHVGSGTNSTAACSTPPSTTAQRRTSLRRTIQETQATDKVHLKTDITIGTLNIVDGRGNRLEMACNRLLRHGVDIAVLTEAKLNGFHTSSAYGYNIVATKCKNQHQGGVALLYRANETWHIEDAITFGQNVVKAILVHDNKRTVIVGVYIPPSEVDLTTIKYLDEAVMNVDTERLLILGDLNVNLEAPKDDRTTEIVDAIGTYGLQNLSRKFKARRKKPFTWTWRKYRDGEKIQAVCDYMLTGSKLHWKNFVVVDVMFDTDHRLIKGRMLSKSSTVYKKYLLGRQKPAVDLYAEHANTDNDQTAADVLLHELHDALPPAPRPVAKSRSWISAQSFALLARKTRALRSNSTEEVRRIGKELRTQLRRDRRRRIDKTSIEIEAKLDKMDIIGAFDILRHWYKKFTGKSVKPSPVTLDKTREVYKNLFSADDFSDELPFEVRYHGEPVPDGAPDETEIKEALFRMRSRKSPGLTGVSVDHLKSWYNRAYPKEGKPDEEAVGLWQKVVQIVQKCIGEGEIPSAFTYGVLVIIPKDDKGGVRGIGLLETLHKLVSQIINMRLNATVKFCEAVHGFRKKRGCFTAIGEAKLRMQMAACSAVTTYQIYLDLRKAYDSIDRKRVLKILEAYRVGPNLRRYIKIVWDKQNFMLRQSGFYSDPFDVSRGCTQGDTDSPIIFNIIIDAVLRQWMSDKDFGSSTAMFYADDGLIEHTEPAVLQKDMDLIIKLFEQLGLRTNETKTKYMVVRGPPAPAALPKVVYDRGRRDGESFMEWRIQDTMCDICGKRMKKGSLQRHMLQQHQKKPEQYLYRQVGTAARYCVEVVKGVHNKCPVPECTGGSKDKFGMYRHFCFRHPEATIVVAADGELQRCNLCGMFAMNMGKHQTTSTCKKGRGRRSNEILQDRQADGEKVTFMVYGKKLERVSEFRYLGRTLVDNDDDTKCIEEQIRRARQKWNSIAKILKREGANAMTMAKFYLAVVQAVLLYGAESWTITEWNWKKLRSFHRRAVRYMTGCHIRKTADDRWEYPNHEALQETCGLFSIETYVQRRRGTLRKYLEENRLDLLKEAMEMTAPSKNSHKVLWWQQEYLTKIEMAKMTNFWKKA